MVERCEVFTTVELVIAEIEGVEFRREPDAKTGYRELVARKVSG